MKVGDRIREMRKKIGMSQVDFAEKINVSKQTLYKYENNIITNIPSDKIEAAARVCGIGPGYFMGWDEVEKPRSKGVQIPVYGKVAAGIPIEMIEDIIDTEEIPEEMARRGEYFGLQISGNSMEPRMKNGDVVIVRRQPDAESGQTVIVTVNGTDATCKRLKKYENGISLISTNPSYEPQFFTNKEIEELPVTILGRVVELRAKF